ncbi:MAG TPA: tetratricopeptide repeat protein [Candidatus Bathyarchaeia archaeon]|nr:tetratricopeptide repeat protein [Candidatus Bathyarchaeia archaeon]
MKRKIFIFIGVLLAIYIVLTLLDQGEYRIEKQLWRMREKYNAVVKDPKAVPDAQFEAVILGYAKLIKRYPDSSYIPQMYSSIGSLYAINKRYEDARKTFGQIVATFADDPTVVSKAMMDIGATYQAEGKQQKAIDVYNRIWEKYGKTEIGFMMPLYMAGIYRQSGDAAQVASYLAKAEAFYRQIAGDKENSDSLRLNGCQALATTQMSQQNFSGALQTLKTALYDFADSSEMNPKRLSAVTRLLNIVLIGQMRDFDKAESFYRDFITTHPGHRLNPYLEKVIESVKVLKEKNQTPVAP